MQEILITSDTMMLAFGAHCAKHFDSRCQVHLHGDLGAGKTTWVRGVIQSLGYQKPVVSPTYPLIVGYDIGEHSIAHLDLYRLTDEDDYLDSGLADEVADTDWVFIEWPQRALKALPSASAELTFSHADSYHKVSMSDLTAQALHLNKFEPANRQ